MAWSEETVSSSTSMSHNGFAKSAKDRKFRRRADDNLPDLRHLLGFIMDCFNYPIIPRCNLTFDQHPWSLSFIILPTSAAALSDCTSHNLSNCSTSVIPIEDQSCHQQTERFSSPSPMSGKRNSFILARGVEVWKLDREGGYICP